MVKNLNGTVPFSAKFGYSIGALSYGIPFQLVSACFVFYATAVLGISGTITGTILSISIVWDAFTDPIMGYISDHTSNRILFGRRLFYIFIGAVGIAITNFLLWRIDPHLSTIIKIVYAAILLLFLKTSLTIFTTPYLALGSELSDNYNERTTIQSFRTAFFFLGFMFPTIIGMAIFFRPTPEFANGQLNPAAYSSLGITASIIVLACAAICIVLTNKKCPHLPVKTSKKTFVNMMKETASALKCNDFRNISFGLLFINMAMGIVGAIGMHVFTYTFHLNNRQIAMVFGALFIMALVAQPIWVYVAKKFEKRTALLACLYINLGVSLLFGVFVIFNSWVAEHYLSILPLALLIGFSMGGSIALPYAMISDTIDKDQYYSGTRKEGVFYGCATFMYKLSQSLSVLFVGTLLDIIKFNSTTVQDSSVYLKLGLILPIGFLICFLLALYFVRKYTLNRQIVTEYQAHIKIASLEQPEFER